MGQGLPNIANSSFEVVLPEETHISGVVLADHVRSVDWLVREAAYIGRASESVITEVRKKVGILI